MNFAQLLFPDFSLILIGYLLCRFTALNRQVWEPVERLVYFLMFPVLLFHSIVKSPLDLIDSLIADGRRAGAVPDGHRAGLLTALVALGGQTL